MTVHQRLHQATKKRTPDDPAPIRRIALTVGAAHDWAEEAADRASHAALARLGAAPGTLRRASLPSMTAAPDAIGPEGGDVSEQVQARIDAARSGGAALQTPVRRSMESAFGTSFAGVRIHQGTEAHQLNRQLGARAFTSGRDIFFGAGQYQPDTAAGQQVLAHELAHTTQQRGNHHESGTAPAAQRMAIHRWNINAPTIDWSQTRSIGTIDSGQPVWFFEDATGDKLVVKQERLPIGLAEMAGMMHESLANVKSVKHRKLATADKQAVGNFITDQAGSRLDRTSWAELGKAQMQHPRFGNAIKNELGDRFDGMDDFQIGHYVHSSTWNPGAQMLAMTYASGDTAKAAAKKGDNSIEARAGLAPAETSRLRKLMLDRKHVQALGKLTAVDLFLGNRDRVMAGNLGNWIYNPDSAAMTAIDHVDPGVSMSFRRDEQSQSAMRDLLAEITSPQLVRTAAAAVDSIAGGASAMAGDTGFAAWLDSGSGFRRAEAEDAMLRGLQEGRRLLIKTFTATRFGSKKARAVKKAIKHAARDAHGVDTDGPDTDRDFYYRVLKARAEYLLKH